MEVRKRWMEGWLWYADDEGNWYRYPYELDGVLEEEVDGRIVKMLMGEEVIDLDIELEDDVVW